MKSLKTPEGHDEEMRRIEAVLGQGVYEQVKHILGAVLNLRDLRFSGAENVTVETQEELESAAFNMVRDGV